MSPALPIPEHEARSFLAAVAELPDPPPAVGYRSPELAFAGALAEARRCTTEPTIERLTAIVQEHADGCNEMRHEYDVRREWGNALRGMRLSPLRTAHQRAFELLCKLARGGR